MGYCPTSPAGSNPLAPATAPGPPNSCASILSDAPISAVYWRTRALLGRTFSELSPTTCEYFTDFVSAIGKSPTAQVFVRPSEFAIHVWVTDSMPALA